MKKIVLFCVVLFSFAFGQNANAQLYRIPGVIIPAGTPGWISDAAGCSIPEKGGVTYQVPQSTASPKLCTFSLPVPWANNAFVGANVNSSLKIVMAACMRGSCSYKSGDLIGYYTVNDIYFRPDRSIGSQNPDFGGVQMGGNVVTNNGKVTLCYYFLPVSNPQPSFMVSDGAEPWCDGFTPLPPTPSVDTCSINNDNSVTIDMGEINRAEISTTAGSGDIKHKSIPVWCSSDSGFSSMPVNLQFSYTPTTFVDGKAIQSSVPEVGISVGYDSRILVSNEVLNLNLPTGDSNMDFTFEAIRDASVAVSDIPTGPFTASGVLIMSLP